MVSKQKRRDHLGAAKNTWAQKGSLGSKREHLGAEGNTWEQKGALGVGKTGKKRASGQA